MAAAVSGRPQQHPHCGWIELLPLVSQHVRSPPGQPKASALGEQISQDGEMLPIRAVGLHTGLTSLGGTDRVPTATQEQCGLGDCSLGLVP